MTDKREKIIKDIANFAAMEVAERNVVNLEQLVYIIEKKKQLNRAKRAFLAQQVNSNALEIVVSPIVKEEPVFEPQDTSQDDLFTFPSLLSTNNDDNRNLGKKSLEEKKVPLQQRTKNNFKIYG